MSLYAKSQIEKELADQAIKLPPAVTILADTYALAISRTNALPTGVSALVTIKADESEGNAGTGTDGINPKTFYVFDPDARLLNQLVTY